MNEDYKLIGYIAYMMSRYEEKNIDVEEVFQIIGYYEDYKKNIYKAD